MLNSGASGQRPLTQRVEVGTYYRDRDGRLIWVEEVSPLGFIEFVDCATDVGFGMGIDAFRRKWWRVK